MIAETGVSAPRAVDSTILADAVVTQDTVTELAAAIRRAGRIVPGAAALLAAEGSPAEVYGDSAYSTGDLRAVMKTGHTAVIKPWPLKPAVEGGFTLDDLSVDESAGIVICPAGEQASTSRRPETLRGIAIKHPSRCTTLDLFGQGELHAGVLRPKQTIPSSGFEPTLCHTGSRPTRCKRSRSSAYLCPATGWCSRKR